MKVPSRSGKVDRALVAVERQVKAVLQQLNQQASKLVTRGNYDAAEELLAVGRSVSDFLKQAENLRLTWRDIRRQKRDGSGRSAQNTPLWEFYRPILQGLAALGGEATRLDLERELEKTLAEALKPGDLAAKSRGVPRWKIMLRRAKRPMTKEGLLERGTGKNWRITTQGRRAIEEAQGTEPAGQKRAAP